MQATAAQVEAVLDDGYLYADWVVGTLLVRDIDPSWPNRGAHLHHRFGLRWLFVQGDSEVLERRPGHMVVEARAHGVGAAKVSIDVKPRASGCQVRMSEAVTAPAAARPFNVALAPLVWLRNQETLRRLDKVAQERADHGAAHD